MSTSIGSLLRRVGRARFSESGRADDSLIGRFSELVNDPIAAERSLLSMWLRNQSCQRQLLFISHIYLQPGIKH